jgi:hypothetical protein
VTLTHSPSRWILGLGLALVGCSDNSLIGPPDEVPPTRVNAVIEVSSDHPTDPHLVDFGQVYAGEAREKDVTIRNIGTDVLQIQDLSLPPGTVNFTILNADELNPPILAPEGQFVARLEYRPLRDEHVESTFNVASNDRENPLVPVRLIAEGLAPAIQIDPPSWDFGNHELGCVGAQDFELRNIGRAPLTIQEVAFEDLSGANELLLTASPGAGTVLQPGEVTVATVSYTPVDVTPDSGVLHVLSDDPSMPDAIASQYGTAHYGATNIDAFYQEGNNSTDILWVVDNSCSMSEEQTSLAVNFAAFMQIVEALDMDYQIGVTTTDIPAQQGHLVGSVPIITPNTPDPSGTFQATVNLGINGSGNEQGLEASYQAIQDSINGGVNAGFLRDDAGLRIIHVTDEAEQSVNQTFPGHGPWTAADYAAYYQSVKANPDHAIVSDISGGLTGCASAGAGTDYVMVTQLTGGVSAAICLPDWSSTLAALAWLSQSFADTFELSQTPVPETIEVRMNTVPVFVGWTFNPALNAVVFDVDHLPENGDTIEVEYTVLGDCAD